jgi:hypothetical protein
VAKDLRARPARLVVATLTIAAAVLIHACGGERGQQPAPRARTVDVAAIAERDLVAAVLDECHKPLRGTMGSVAAKVKRAGGTEVQLFAILPDKLRVQADDGSYLLTGDMVFRLGDGVSHEAAPEATARVRQLRTLLDAAAFGPLYRATGCRRSGPNEFELTQPDGSVCKLHLRDHSLLPESLASPAGEVRVVDYLRTPTTWIAKQLELDGLGRCEVQFNFGKIDWDPGFFASPTAAKSDSGGKSDSKSLMRITPGAVPENRSPVPVLDEAKATRWVCIADPGNWAARVAAYRPVHSELERQRQQIAGFPIFWREEDKPWIAAPFRQRPNGPALQAPKDWQLREVPAGRVLQVWPPAESLEEKLASGERLLREALQTQRLSPAGPILTQYYLHLEEGEPPPEKLATAVVRMAVAVR